MDSASPIRTSSRPRPSAPRTHGRGKGDDYQGKGDDYQGKGDDYQGKGDVEGHSFVNPAPPADFSKPGPSSGGESVHNHEDADASD